MDGVEPDDEGYPDAPLPAHERAWRHPSEVGEATWQRSEPPLTIGRGLLVTTGAIGGLLALAVLWAMLPTAAGGGPQAISTEPVRTTRQAISTVSDATSSSDSATLAATTHAPTSTIKRATQPSTTQAGTTRSSLATSSSEQDDDGTTTVTTGSSTASTPGDGSLATTSRSDRPATTASNATQATISVAGASEPTTAIAVAVAGVPVVLTTASAVRQSSDTVTLSFDDGRTAEATVAMTVNGIALLTTPDSSTASATFKIASSPHDGDDVTLLGSTPATVTVRVDDAGNLSLPSWGGADVAEGTPVVNAQGKVVALCSKSSDGPKLVTVNQSALRTALASTTGSTGVATPGRSHLGVTLNLDPKGSLTIFAVEPDGPAAAVGIVAGDTVLAVDGEALASSDDLFNALADHVPGDEVAVTVGHADGTQSTYDVVLGVTPTRA
ncbi:MAG: PDZ domain-containing protein [Ilumatobacteraceae bacterium]